MKPVQSIRSMRLERNLIKQQIYSASLLASSKYGLLLKSLNAYNPDKSFFAMDLGKSVKLLAELNIIKKQTLTLIARYNSIDQQLNLRGRK